MSTLFWALTLRLALIANIGYGGQRLNSVVMALYPVAWAIRSLIAKSVNVLKEAVQMIRTMLNSCSLFCDASEALTVTQIRNPAKPSVSRDN